jgi:hypothetical protein
LEPGLESALSEELTMAIGTACNFLKSIIPGLKGACALARGGGSSSLNAFRAAHAAGQGTRFANLASAARTGARAGRATIVEGWQAAGRLGYQRPMINAGIAVGGGTALLALNRGRHEARYV